MKDEGGSRVTKIRLLPVILGLLTLSAALLVAAACGDDDDGDGEASPTTEPSAATATPTGASGVTTIGDLTITGPFARGAIDRGAVYFTVSNEGAQDDALIGAASSSAPTVELHETVTEGASTMMRPVDRIEIPAGGEAVLEPGGLHVMLIDPTEELAMGSTILVTLDFENAGSVEIEATVTSYNASPMESGMGMTGSASPMQ
jgi:copper(I)-binding protein